MVSWSEGSYSSSSDSDISSRAPPSILCVEWTGLATDVSARCEHQAICEKYVAFQSVDSGRRFLGCAQKKMLARDILVHMLPYSHFAYQWTILIIGPQEEAMYTHAE
ncbi:hypothetical protein ZWY2020_052799 [Hordeum vulgare]|nr:hypothetical protein ZWY2020_052799 [Hordeum vulgare]